MAVFMVNVCKFDGCGITFPSLADLIFHIEDTHIDYDPAVVKEKEKQQPQCLPLSYVLKFFTNTARRETQQLDIKRRILQHAKRPIYHAEPDDEELATDTEDSNESWTTSEEFSSEFILRYGSKANGTSQPNLTDKPFACPVPGCKKRYKNINGIKYHSKNGHKKDGKVRKGYRCHCGKSYKTSQGLKSHSSYHDKNTRSITVKHNVVSKSDMKMSLGVAKLKSFIENNKILVPKIQTPDGNNKVLDCDLGILTPAISPDSSLDDNKYCSSVNNSQLNLGAFSNV